MIETEREIGTSIQRELPDGWLWVRLGDVCEITMGQSPPSETYRVQPEGLPFFQGKADFGPASPVARTWCVSPTKVALPGDILISVRAPVGPTNIADVECCIGRGLAAIRARPDTDRDFILLSLRNYESALAELGSGSTFEAINRAVLESLLIPRPPLPEQRRIAAILREQMAAVDRARAAAETQLAAAKALPAAYLCAVFDSADAMSWPHTRIGDIAILGPDNGIFKQREHFGRGAPIVNVSDLYKSLAVELSATERVETSASELSRFAIAKGDLFFCRSSLKREGVGWCCYADEVREPSVFECHVMRVRPDPDKVYSAFIAHYWRHPAVREQVITTSKTATMTTMNQEDLARIPIPLPTLPEQQRIAATLTEQMAGVERARTALEEQLDAINQLPAALLRQAFRGEV